MLDEMYPGPSALRLDEGVAGHCGSAKAACSPPVGPLGFILLPPAAITTYWRPLTSYVAGVALPGKGSVYSHSNLPVALSNARIFWSKLVAPISSKPPAVTI